MSDVFRINTEEIVNNNLQPQVQIPTFELVAEDDPILREVMPEFNFDYPLINPAEFASSLIETCKKNQGIGLSASQCGFRHRVFVMGAGDDYVAHFNPKLLSHSEESHMIEGCLSFPLLGLRITRPSVIEVEYEDFTGASRTAKYAGISARCFLHELDHMNGIVYTTRAKPLALQSGLKKRVKLHKMITRYVKAQEKIQKTNG